MTHAPTDQGPDLLGSGWYTTEELATLMKVDPSTVRRWRTQQPVQGPPFVRVSGRTTLYSVDDVRAWLQSRRTDPGAS
ncbi:helix-turn-helix domain-containing protein [Nonomuraea salmonea]|uniref:Helix-turn-helix domain-containing protein n=1 Tax=Nonomuraea salmonea TaxID=46181 RepID=A0ABV5NJW8_9ACTN